MFKTLRYIVCYSLSSPKPVKSPANPVRYSCQNICTWKRTLKTILRKKSHFLSWSTSLLHKLILLKLWLILRMWPVQVCFTGTGINLGDVQLNYLNSFSLLPYEVYSSLQPVAWFFCHHSKISVTYWFFPCVASYGC